MNAYQPLNCDLHDYLEIACLHGYLLDIELVDGRRFQAKARTTRTSNDKEEFLGVDTANAQQEIRLDQLSAVLPLDRNAKFGRIVFPHFPCN